MKRKACTKARYATACDARQAIGGMAQRFGGFVFKRPYRCGRCRAFHITSTPPTKARRKQW